MKKSKISINDVRNFAHMSVKNQRKYARAFVIVAISVRIIKGKLGFNMRTNDSTFVTKARGIFTALTNNTGSFYTPAFTGLATIDTQADALQSAINAFEQGGLGTEEAKLIAKRALKITLDAALGYVNNLAFLDQANAIQIITGADMLLVRPPFREKPDFEVKQSTATGEINLISKAIRFDGKLVRGFYEWQYSTDNGATWVSLDSTTIAKTTAMDMEVGVNTLFRKRTTSRKTGVSAWCPAIAITPA